jgi:hypothetical protein
VAIGRTAECKVLVKNLSKISTIYKVNIPKEVEHLLTVTARTGTILAENMAELCFRLASPKTMVLDSLVEIAVKGSRNFELPVRANIILPQIYVESEEVDFGSVPIEGNPGERQINLVNEASIAVDLELRLPNDTFLAKCLRLGELLDGNLQVVETRELKAFKVICLRVAPKSKAAFMLQFFPETVDEYEFYLPLFIPCVEPTDELQKLCRCQGVKNKLIAMSKHVTFGKIVIEQAEQTYSKSQTLEIFNPQDEPINWWVDDAALAPFKLDRKNGRLEGFDKFQLKIFFSAETPGEYSRELRFFLDQTEVDISQCYMKVAVTAEACYPALYFDQPYLILPTVHCGETSSAVLEIFNGGYENINLKHIVIQEFSNIDLKVRYLTGSNLGVTRKQIKVEIGFASEKPVSFTVKVSFFDNNGRSFTINVSGTADTQVFTLIDQDRGTAGWGANLEKSCQFMRHYINTIGHLPDELYEFPKSLIENDYDKLSLLLGSYSSAFEKAKAAVKKNCRTFFAFEYISEVIKLLKAEGAFLNHIRPEMLLPFEEYLENIRIRAEDNATVLGHFRKKERAQFDLEQKQSWLILFYQIFKVFSRVSPGKLKNGCEFWLKFQAREKILLGWL